MNTHTENQTNHRGKVLAILTIYIFISGCASTGNKELSSIDKEVKQHELFDGDINSNKITEGKLKTSDTTKELSEKELSSLTEAQLSETRKNSFTKKAELALSSGNYDFALYSYMRALLEDDKDTNLYYKIGELHESKDNMHLATLAYERAIKLDSDFILGLEKLGKIHLNNRDYIAAKSLFERSLEADINRFNKDNQLDSSEYIVNSSSPFYAFIGLGIISDLDRNHKNAIVYFSKAIKSRPNSASAESNLGYSFYLNNEFSEAETHFKRAIAKDNNYDKAWSNLALIYVRQGKYKDAVDLLINHYDDRPSAYNTVGYLCMLIEKYEHAEQLFNKAIELSPAFFEIAVENRELNRKRQSESIYKRLN